MWDKNSIVCFGIVTMCTYSEIRNLYACGLGLDLGLGLVVLTSALALEFWPRPCTASAFWPRLTSLQTVQLQK